MALWDYLRRKFSPTVWAVANFCPFLITVTATERPGRSLVTRVLPRSPGEARAAPVVPAGPLTHLGLDDGAVQGAVLLVVEKAELQGTQGGWRGQRQNQENIHSVIRQTFPER